jgi:hypothetical protein
MKYLNYLIGGIPLEGNRVNFYGGMTPREERIYKPGILLLFVAIVVLAFVNYKFAWVPAVMMLQLRGWVEAYFKWRRRAFIKKFEKDVLQGDSIRKPGETDSEYLETIAKFIRASIR